MAERYDKELVTQVGIHYEVHDKSAKEVAEFYSIPPKTVESWITRNGWKRGRLKGKADELKKELDREKYAAVVGQMASDGITDKATEVMGGDVIKASYLLEVLALEQISSSALDNQIKWAVQKAQPFVTGAKNIGTIKTYAEIVKMAKETIHGKSPEVAISFQLGDLSPQQMASMSQGELRAMMKQIEDDLSQMKTSDIKKALSTKPQTEVILDGNN